MNPCFIHPTGVHGGVPQTADSTSLPSDSWAVLCHILVLRKEPAQVSDVNRDFSRKSLLRVDIRKKHRAFFLNEPDGLTQRTLSRLHHHAVIANPLAREAIVCLVKIRPRRVRRTCDLRKGI